MGLTDKQLRDFAEYLMPEKKESPTMQINATVHSIDSTGEKPIYYVNFDGAEGTEPCPVNSTIAEGERTLAEGDRVIVLVKDREGTIVGNIDKPIETSEAYDDSWLLGEDGALAEAAKYATNYMKFTEGQYHPITNPNAGLVLSENAEATNLGRNLQLMSGGIMIRNNTTPLATFDEDDIYLGLNNDSAEIHLCNDAGTIFANGSSLIIQGNDVDLELSNSYSTSSYFMGSYINCSMQEVHMKSYWESATEWRASNAEIIMGVPEPPGQYIDYGYITLNANEINLNGRVYIDGTMAPNASSGYMRVDNIAFKWGKVNITAAKDTVATAMVGFSSSEPTYTSAPIVVFGIENSGTSIAYGFNNTMRINSVSTTGFNAAYYNQGTSSHTFTMHWLAMGTI